MSSTINYVADHIDRIERRHAGNPEAILNSKWRIASAVDLLYNLNPDGTLTPDQVGHVDKYIAWFKSTEEGQKVIAQYQRRPG
jgi:hypothetical protein